MLERRSVKTVKKIAKEYEHELEWSDLLRFVSDHYLGVPAVDDSNPFTEALKELTLTWMDGMGVSEPSLRYESVNSVSFSSPDGQLFELWIEALDFTGGAAQVSLEVEGEGKFGPAKVPLNHKYYD